ncbi:type III polyketide synthase [Flammeovirga sp. MY04]|nr:type III polyketide synthase [Flammeovirga sp. MY04]ANQ52316.1 type III polyketide synthase [Flammeovirga sp. MY04]
MTYIHKITTASPKNVYSQSELEKLMHEVYQFNTEKEERLMRMIYHKSGIDKRKSVIDDFLQFFKSDIPPSLEERIDVFKDKGLALAKNAADSCLVDEDRSSITHIITVSCTGISAPGIDIDLIQLLELQHTTVRTTVNFMGCYAAFHALRLADQICKSTPKSKVLIVDVELCSLHFQNKTDDDNLLANTLFADGAAAILLSSDKRTDSLFEIDDFASRLSFQGKKDMAWDLSSTGFQMKLSTYVPRLIEQDIKVLLDDVLNDKNIQRDQLRWAFHPGGQRILTSIAKALSIDLEDLQPSFEVLKENGNMSSVSILFVLKKISQINEDNPIFAAGFGPGLTMEAMTLNRV